MVYRSRRNDVLRDANSPRWASKWTEETEDEPRHPQGAWTQIKGKVREQWGKLTDDDLDQMQGNAEQLIGKLKERYGRSREQAET